jgi:hypothetical protein
MHYTQQPSRVTTQTNTAMTIMYSRMQGYITAPMLTGELDGWDARYTERLPSALLLDLRDVAGYGPGTPSIARRWLTKSESRGVQRIAFIASSSVIRTIVRVISPDVNVQMRCFASESSAIEWLEGRPVSDAAAAVEDPAPTKRTRRKKSRGSASRPRP